MGEVNFSQNIEILSNVCDYDEKLLLTGAAIIGDVTGKILDYEVRQKFCMKCAKNLVHEKINCSRNFEGKTTGI